MAVRIKQVDTVKIDILVGLARQSGAIDDIGIARWIISASSYWRNKGYDEIIKSMKEVK